MAKRALTFAAASQRFHYGERRFGRLRAAFPLEADAQIAAGIARESRSLIGAPTSGGEESSALRTIAETPTWSASDFEPVGREGRPMNAGHLKPLAETRTASAGLCELRPAP